MQGTLVLFLLLGLSSICVCLCYEYHFIKEKKSWSEAQTYCKDHYTDLATVHNKTDMMRLNLTSPKAGWIGLSKDARRKSLKCSDPEVKFNLSQIPWGTNQPNNKPDENEDCVMVKKNGEFHDDTCDQTHPFICENETVSTDSSLKKNWLEAQEYCREHNTDLFCNESVPAHRRHDGYVWTGLFKDNWIWSDNSYSSFRNWDSKSFVYDDDDDDDSKKCAMTLETTGKWTSDECKNEKPFFCYDDKMILIKQKKTWEGALDYCRDHHHSLVSITNQHLQNMAYKRAAEAESYVWLGLRYTCTMDLWFWINDSLVSFNKWAPNQDRKGCDSAVAMGKNGRWYKKSDSETFYFICVTEDEAENY